MLLDLHLKSFGVQLSPKYRHVRWANSSWSGCREHLCKNVAVHRIALVVDISMSIGRSPYSILPHFRWQDLKGFDPKTSVFIGSAAHCHLSICVSEIGHNCSQGQLSLDETCWGHFSVLIIVFCSPSHAEVSVCPTC